VNFRGAYQESALYERNDVVTSEGWAWVCTHEADLGVRPSESSACWAALTNPSLYPELKGLVPDSAPVESRLELLLNDAERLSLALLETRRWEWRRGRRLRGELQDVVAAVTALSEEVP
jgi:hypothetical protein